MISAGHRIRKHKASWSDTVTILHCLYLPEQQPNTGSFPLWELLQQRTMLKHAYPSCTIIMGTVHCVLNCPPGPQLVRERMLNEIWWLPIHIICSLNRLWWVINPLYKSLKESCYSVWSKLTKDDGLNAFASGGYKQTPDNPVITFILPLHINVEKVAHLSQLTPLTRWQTLRRETSYIINYIHKNLGLYISV